MDTSMACEAGIARVNGVSLNRAEETLSNDELRQRACSELLRQEAMNCGMLAAGDSAEAGVLSEAASDAIEKLLEDALLVPEPDDEACRRQFLAHRSRYSIGERTRLRHILFAVTDGVDVVALRNRAEAALLDVRCHDGKSGSDAFAEAARTLSNCPSGANGGALDWLEKTDCAPEFAAEIFGHPEIGVLPRLVHSRFGFHVVEVLERQPGVDQPFDAVREAVRAALRRTGYVTALRQYLDQLAEKAEIDGVSMEMHA